METDISKIGSVRLYRLGTRLITSCGGRFQYGKIDFGTIGKTIGKVDGKVFRNIRYRWFPKNRSGAESQIGFIY